MNEGTSESVDVFSWGRGDYGQLGISGLPEHGRSEIEQNISQPPEFCSMPAKLIQLRGKQACLVAGNLYHSLALTVDGEVYVMGLNESGQLGCRGRASQSAPLRLEALESHKVVHASCGQNHSVVVTAQGGLAVWGAGEFGQLGLGEDVGVDLLHPRLIKMPKEVKFAGVACGACHTLALTRSGHVYAFGQGTFGALGLGSDEGSYIPRVVGGRLWWRAVCQIACGDHHSAALDMQGKVYTWGRGKYGQLGLGKPGTKDSPCEVRDLKDFQVNQVVCGGEHTLCLEAGGAVFAWGRGRNGQLGSGTRADQHSPVRVEGLLESNKMRLLTAGSRHSLALGEEDGHIYAWGCNEYGQLGFPPGDDKLEPVLVPSAPPMAVLSLAGSGDHTLAIMLESTRHEGLSNNEIAHRLSVYGSALRPLRLPSLLTEAETAKQLAGEDPTGTLPSNHSHMQTLLRSAETVFSSVGFLMHGFCLPSTGRQREGPGLDVQSIELMYKALLGSFNTELLSLLARSATLLAQGMRAHSPSFPPSPPASAFAAPLPGDQGGQGGEEDTRLSADETHPERPEGHDQDWPRSEWRRAVLGSSLVLLQSPLCQDPRYGGTCLQALHSLVLSLPVEEQRALVDNLMHYPSDIFGARFVRACQRLISFRVSHSAVGRADDLTVSAAKVLALMHTANEKAGLVHYSEFYNGDLSKHLHLKDEYLGWTQRASSAPPDSFFSFCQLPFLLTPETKTIILQGEANLQKHHTLLMSSHFHHPQDFLNLRIRREFIRSDALEQILQRPQDLKKPLRVKFISKDVEEEAVDEGGVTKEFFQLLVREVFLAEFGMFSYCSETRTFWFSLTAMELDPHQAELEFQLVGVVLGLAIYNQVLLDVHLLAVVYKKLKYLDVSFSDLETAQPATAKGLRQLLDYDGDIQSDICRTFEVEYECLGERRTHPLVPGGEEVYVTQENKELFVELYTRWLLEESVSRQFAAFASGFLQVCGGPALSLFRYEELELLVCGLPHLDFEALQRGTKYDAGYHPTHPTILVFWEVLHSFDMEQKKRFLFFTTGCDRAPVGGLATLQFVIQRSGPDCDRLPSAHTCFNTLLLPEYGSRGKMRHHLLIAIENSEGFGLQ